MTEHQHSFICPETDHPQPTSHRDETPLGKVVADFRERLAVRSPQHAAIAYVGRRRTHPCGGCGRCGCPCGTGCF